MGYRIRLDPKDPVTGVVTTDNPRYVLSSLAKNEKNWELFETPEEARQAFQAYARKVAFSNWVATLERVTVMVDTIETLIGEREVRR